MNSVGKTTSAYEAVFIHRAFSPDASTECDDRHTSRDVSRSIYGCGCWNCLRRCNNVITMASNLPDSEFIGLAWRNVRSLPVKL